MFPIFNSKLYYIDYIFIFSMLSLLCSFFELKIVEKKKTLVFFFLLGCYCCQNLQQIPDYILLKISHSLSVVIFFLSFFKTHRHTPIIDLFFTLLLLLFLIQICKIETNMAPTSLSIPKL